MRAALRFLTVLPVGGRDGEPRATTLLAFPLAGLVVGLAWALVADGASRGLPTVAVAALVVLTDVAITGALHLDAVGDVGDGFAARRAGADPQRAMSDPRLGAVGAATLVAVLLVRAGLLVAVVVQPWLAALWLVPVVGRAAMVVALWTSPSRPGSLASGFLDAATGPVAAAVVALTVALAAVAVVAGAAPVTVAVTVLAALTIGWATTRVGLAAFDRSSGDVVGAAGVAAETVALTVLAWEMS